MCRNGNLACTRRACPDGEGEDTIPEADRRCLQCGKKVANPVCGSDGRTYPSACHAVNCTGLQPDTVTAGPCSRQVSSTVPYTSWIRFGWTNFYCPFGLVACVIVRLTSTVLCMLVHAVEPHTEGHINWHQL